MSRRARRGDLLWSSAGCSFAAGTILIEGIGKEESVRANFVLGGDADSRIGKAESHELIELHRDAHRFDDVQKGIARLEQVDRQASR